MNAHDFLRYLGRRWISLIIALVIGVGAGVAYKQMVAPTYDATTRLMVSVNAPEAAVVFQSGGSYVLDQTATYVELAQSAIVLGPVIDTLGLDETVADLQKRVSVDSPVNTAFLEITAEDPSAEQAALIANTVAAQLDTVLEAQTASGKSSIVEGTVTDPAVTPLAPSHPSWLSTVGLGVLATLLLWLALVTLRAWWSNEPDAPLPARARLAREQSEE